MRRRDLIAAAAGALAATALAGGVAWATIPGDGGVIQACHTKVGGSLRVIDTAKGEKCHANLEVPISWNQVGQPGATGPAGPAGPQGEKGDKGGPGPPGTEGAAGAQGPQGERGPQGEQGPQGVQGPPGIQGAPGTPGTGAPQPCFESGPTSALSVGGCTVVVPLNGGAITSLTGGVDGQIVTIVGNDPATSLVDGIPFRLRGDVSLGVGDTLQLANLAGGWYEISRSDN